MFSPQDEYGEPPYRRTEWLLHLMDGQLVLEERVLAADEALGEYTRVISHSMTPVRELDYPSPAKFEALAGGLSEGEYLALDPSSDYWDELDADPEIADALATSEAYIARRAGEHVAELVIPTLARAVQRAAGELVADGVADREIAAEYVLEALTRYLEQDAGVMGYALVSADLLATDNARDWFDLN
ncbi:MAG: hypothetical protein IT323_19520, partial [Anaerolineae bacterium]|nr:hypothetical protein [Anaerolineae bacterium]